MKQHHGFGEIEGSIGVVRHGGEKLPRCIAEARDAAAVTTHMQHAQLVDRAVDR